MSIAPASLTTWLLRALAAVALLAFVASTGPLAEAALVIETTQVTIEPVGEEIAGFGSDPLAADDPAPLDLLPTQISLVGPSPARSKHVVTDDCLASFDTGHLDRPPRLLPADPGCGNRRGA